MTDLNKADLASVAELPWEEAWLLAGRLEAEGIPARVFPESKETPFNEAQAFPLSSKLVADIGLGRTSFQVVVPRKRLAEARAIVEQIERT